MMGGPWTPALCIRSCCAGDVKNAENSSLDGAVAIPTDWLGLSKPWWISASIPASCLAFLAPSLLKVLENTSKSYFQKYNYFNTHIFPSHHIIY